MYWTNAFQVCVRVCDLYIELIQVTQCENLGQIFPCASYLRALRSFLLFTCPLFQIKLHLVSTALLNFHRELYNLLSKVLR